MPILWSPCWRLARWALAGSLLAYVGPSIAYCASGAAGGLARSVTKDPARRERWFLASLLALMLLMSAGTIVCGQFLIELAVAHRLGWI